MLNSETVRICCQNDVDTQIVELLLKSLKEAKPSKGTKHVSGQNFCIALKNVVLEECGLLSRAVLEHHNIYSTRDIGLLIFKLIELGVLSQSEEDKLEDFNGVYDFNKVFDINKYIEAIPL